MTRRLLWLILIVAGILTAGYAQESTPAPAASSSQAGQTQPSADEQQQDTTEQKPPSKLKKILRRAKPNCAHVGGAGGCWSESEQEKEARKKEAGQAGEKQQPPLPSSQPAPRSDSGSVAAGESSSRQTQIDLSPPAGDNLHEGADLSDVQEFHPYDPHKAEKDIEIGDFYFKQRNYVAAESRYAEALQWKPNDAIATFRLAQSQEKLGKMADAITNYRAYLKILPRGDFADDCRKALDRLAPKDQARDGATYPPAQKPR